MNFSVFCFVLFLHHADWSQTSENGTSGEENGGMAESKIKSGVTVNAVMLRSSRLLDLMVI